MFDLSLWFMFPISMAIATIAMMSGIGGAVMFSPIFMLVLGLDTVTALALGLFIEIFGFSSGVIGYWSKKLIDFKVARDLLWFVIPSAIVGVIIGKFIPSIILKSLLILLLIYLSIQFLFHKKKCTPKHPNCTEYSNDDKLSIEKSEKKFEGAIPLSIKMVGVFGGLFLGAISAGLGETNEYIFVKKMRMPLSLASGTSVFIVAFAALIGIFTHFIFLIQSNELSVLTTLTNILIFVIPGVIIGAQIGVRLSQKFPLKNADYFMGILFILLALIVVLSLF